MKKGFFLFMFMLKFNHKLQFKGEFELWLMFLKVIYMLKKAI